MISIVNYGMGNIRSVQNALNQLGIENRIISTSTDILNSSKLILPGVGSFRKAMEVLEQKELISPLNKAVLELGMPILGICLGMQLFSEKSEEGDMNGLGWIQGEVVKFSDADNIKIPHVGFNNVNYNYMGESLFENIKQGADYYFVHSYHFHAVNQKDIVATTFHGTEVVAAVGKNNILGVQFHPEKSQTNGLRLITNFDRFK